jgi:hypothetical protein
MLDTAIAYTAEKDVAAAARDLSRQIESGMNGAAVDALILFASPAYDQPGLLRAVMDLCKPKTLVGASSAGEFTSGTQGTGLACALALRSDELLFSAGVGHGVGVDRQRAAHEIAKSFRGSAVTTHPHRAALVMTDALAGYTDDLVDQLTLATAGQYQFFGGGAGDDAQFRRTQVFCGTEALSDAAVALEILSKKPIGIGVGHGWLPAGSAMRVTEVRGATIVSLNGEPAADAFEQHAQKTGQAFDRAAPLPFFLHNIVGIDTGSGHRLRVPLAIDAGGAVTCASAVPLHAKIHIMKTVSTSAVAAAKRATQSAVSALGGATPKTALFFDCVATRLRIGEAFGLELEALARELGPTASYLGCNTHGQIARAEGQFGGFHNCTAVVCVLPE